MAEFALPQFNINPVDRDITLNVLDSMEKQLVASGEVGATRPQPSEATIHQRVRRQIICQQIASIKQLLVSSTTDSQ